MAKYKATIQYPKTPKLRIFKTDDGKFAISYGGEDPLSSMSEKTNSLDKEIQRLFGYSGWQEYKEKNSVDLKKAVKRDQWSYHSSTPGASFSCCIWIRRIF